MRRILAILMMILLLSGCGGAERQREVSREEKTWQEHVSAPTLKEQAVSREEPAPVREIGSGMPEQPETREAVPEDLRQTESDALAAKAGAVYAAITEGDFAIWVVEPDGTVTTLEVVSGINDWNVKGREHTFSYTYQWSEATYEDWRDQWTAEDAGLMVTLAAPEEMSLASCTGGDIIEVVDGGRAVYLRAVNLREGADLFAWNFCGVMLNVIAADALSYEMWNVTADGGLHPREAAEQMLDQIAATTAPPQAGLPGSRRTRWQTRPMSSISPGASPRSFAAA